ncbi:MAG: OmpH family outer membrane protein [Ferruginibacter sp.]|nr:OmpH family outer membrane protein [Ferruginibacter sp.]
MKKLIAAVVFGISIFGLTDTAFSQIKIGYINTEELIGAMPEAEKATGQLQDYQTALQQQGNDFQTEFQEKEGLFTKDSAKLSVAAKELRRTGLVELYQKIQGWREVMQQKLQEKQQELLVPIRNKALETIKAVAKENAYIYVLDQNSVIVGPPGDDILPLVKKKLNIKESVPKTQAPGVVKPKP